VSSIIEALWNIDYKEIPVSPREFFTSQYYFGDNAGKLYPKWLDDLEEVLDSKNKIYEWCLTGCIGSGKTTVACSALMYKLYQILCLRNPHEFFGLMSVQPISFVLFSIFKYKAYDTVYEKLKNMLNSSPYFREKIEGRYKKTTFDFYKQLEELEIKLPSSVRIIVGSKGEHALSEDIFGGILDEVNFRKAEAGVTESKYLNTALGVYEAVARRIKSRFGGLFYSPVLLCLISSKRSNSSFLEQYIQKVKNEPGVKVSSYALWEVKSKHYSKKKFVVLVGTSGDSCRILDNPVEIQKAKDEGENLIEVPEDFRREFSADVVSALRDIAGVSIEGYKSYIYNPSFLEGVFDSSRKGIVKGFKIGLLDSYEARIGLRDDREVIDFINLDKLVEGNSPKYFSSAGRVIHVDLSKTGDATGIAMGCIDTAIVRTEVVSGRQTQVKLPRVWIDFVIRIKSLEKDEIDYDKIVSFIKLLASAYNFNIKQVTYDGFQSVHSLQSLARAGFNVKTYSVDKSNSPAYNELLQLLKTKRIAIPEDAFLKWELKNLVREEKDNGTIKIDHQDFSSKDCADALAGVVGNLLDLWNRGEIQVENMSYQDDLQILKQIKNIKEDLDDFSDLWVIQDYKEGLCH